MSRYRVPRQTRTVCLKDLHNFGMWRKNFLTEKDYRTCRKCQVTQLRDKDGNFEMMFA